MKGRVIASTIALLLALAVAAAAQDTPASPPGNATLDTWVGSWTATGTMFQVETNTSVTWRWILDGWYFQGEETATMNTSDGPVTVRSITVLIPSADGGVHGYYLNDQGEHHRVMVAIESESVATLTWQDTASRHHYTVTHGEEGRTASMQTERSDGYWFGSGSMTYARVSD